MALTGLHKNSFENLQIDAGAAFKNLGDLSGKSLTEFKNLLSAAQNDPFKRIGATDGGFKFSAAAELRNPSVDGSGKNVKGLSLMSGVDVKLSFTSREITEDNWVMAIGSASYEIDGVGHICVTPSFGIKDEDYISDVTFVGELNDGKTIVAVQLMNVLNTAGVSFQTKNKGEGGFSYELKAHVEDPWDTVPPYKIHYFGNEL